MPLARAWMVPAPLDRALRVMRLASLGIRALSPRQARCQPVPQPPAGRAPGADQARRTPLTMPETAAVVLVVGALSTVAVVAALTRRSHGLVAGTLLAAVGVLVATNLVTTGSVRDEDLGADGLASPAQAVSAVVVGSLLVVGMALTALTPAARQWFSARRRPAAASEGTPAPGAGPSVPPVVPGPGAGWGGPVPHPVAGAPGAPGDGAPATGTAPPAGAYGQPQGAASGS